MSLTWRRGRWWSSRGRCPWWTWWCPTRCSRTSAGPRTCPAGNACRHLRPVLIVLELALLRLRKLKGGNKTREIQNLRKSSLQDGASAWWREFSVKILHLQHKLYLAIVVIKLQNFFLFTLYYISKPWIKKTSIKYRNTVRLIHKRIFLNIVQTFAQFPNMQGLSCMHLFF